LAAGLLVSATLWGGLFAAVATAQEKKLPYNKVQQLCQQFEQVMPPPPPVESVLVGTLDMNTGQFTWGPSVYAKTVEDNSLILDMAAPFNERHIRPIVPALDPRITTLGAVEG